MNRRGITLLEVMVTLAIVGVMMALAVPSFGQAIANGKSTAFVRQLYQEVKHARQVARSKNQAVRFIRKSVTVGGKTFNAVQWERVPCADPWGYVCPSPACQTNICGAGGCVCDEVGDQLEEPANTDASAILGLCFQSGTGVPKARSGGNDCLDANPAAASVAVTNTSGEIRTITLEPLTGMARLQ